MFLFTCDRINYAEECGGRSFDFGIFGIWLGNWNAEEWDNLDDSLHCKYMWNLINCAGLFSSWESIFNLKCIKNISR